MNDKDTKLLWEAYQQQLNEAPGSLVEVAMTIIKAFDTHIATGQRRDASEVVRFKVGQIDTMRDEDKESPIFKFRLVLDAYLDVLTVQQLREVINIIETIPYDELADVLSSDGMENELTVVPGSTPYAKSNIVKPFSKRDLQFQWEKLDKPVLLQVMLHMVNKKSHEEGGRGEGGIQPDRYI